ATRFGHRRHQPRQNVRSTHNHLVQQSFSAQRCAFLGVGVGVPKSASVVNRPFSRRIFLPVNNSPNRTLRIHGCGCRASRTRANLHKINTQTRKLSLEIKMTSNLGVEHTTAVQ
ncbi:unnamed protein product, partial [Ectocarpus sp. 12 AP-2014]